VQPGLTHSKLMLAATRPVNAPTVKSVALMLDLEKCKQMEKDRDPRFRTGPHKY
jgi:hypothetical protein